MGSRGSQASVVAACELRSCDSWALEHGLSCSVACDLLPDQGLNLCLLHWQAGSLPVSHQGSPPLSLRFHSTATGHPHLQSTSDLVYPKLDS